MKTALLLTFLSGALVYGHHDHHHHHHADENHIGFSWEDFSENGLVHAVQGGKLNDKATYIGQVKHVVDGKDVLTPGIIYPDEKEMVYDSDTKGHKVHEHIKILCTNYPDHMEWFSTNTEDIKKLVHEKELIEGGVDQHDHKIYIGRLQTDSGLLIGKVLIDDSDAGFHAVVDSDHVHKTSFEVLAHVMKH